MKKRDPIAEYCQDWVRWCETRRFYAQPPAKSALAKLQPSKSGTEPNARNHADMQYFNMAVHTLADMPKWKKSGRAFLAYYVGPAQVAKRTADELGMGKRTYYDHVTRFSAAAFSLAASIKRVQESMAPAQLGPPGRKPS